MTPDGFVVFLAATAGMFALPLLSMLGTPVVWGLLVFFIPAVAGVWYAIRRNQRDHSLREELALWQDRVELQHVPPRGPVKEWVANPYWVSVHLDPEGGPVENYLTLKGGDREVEIGAFLSPEERACLRDELIRAFAK
jgi:uncharacterized membrane protein